MKKVPSILSVTLIAVIDLLACILIFVLLEDQKDIDDEIFSFSYGGSTFDLVIWSCFRLCIFLGASIGLVRNPNSVKKFRNSTKMMVYYGCGQAIYVVLKIMFFTEYNMDKMGKRVWLLIGISLFTCLTPYIGWKIYADVPIVKRKQGFTSINDDGDDTDSIKSDDSEKEENLNALDKEVADQYGSFHSIRQLVALAKDDLPYVMIAIFSLLLCSAAQIFLPYYTGQVLNYIVIDRSVEKFKEAMLYMAIITLAAGFFSGTRAGFFTLVFARYVLRLQKQLFESIMKMEIGFFDVRKTGEITSRLTSDCTKVGDGLGLNFNIFLRSIVRVIGILAFMLKISWRLSIVTLVSVPVIGILSEAFGDKYRKLAEQVQNSLAVANESAEEAISCMRTVRSFAAESEEVDRYSEHLQKTYKIRVKEAILVCGYRWSTELTDLTMTLIILYFGGQLVFRNELSGGHLVSFILYSMDLGYAIDDIGNVYTGLMEAVGASKKILVYMQREPKITYDGNQSPDSGIDGHIQFKDVSFSYPSRPDIPVLDKINFTVNKGEVVALVGPSGGGKSSIINLLEHFYEPTNGQVLIDNIDVKNYDHNFIHTTMSLVQQEPVLFARKISENINYGLKPKADQDLIKNSAIMANAHDFVDDLPEKYATETGEKGVQLSGGQKQRVAIARALIRNPTILILDEATSALDSESEYIVQQAINKNLTGRTVLLIAHRLSTVEKADKILVIEKGKIVEEGNHKDLVDKGGVYSALVQRQLLGYDDEHTRGGSRKIDIHKSDDRSHPKGSPEKHSYSVSPVRC
ncbi:ABC-type oligopeptide transporter ABCB9-like [Clytia hemisphaerica]|uniref:Uncharacterized protein n=1 Tax=Clytia hemisphaerica TaxID=252671 RepID=A0A7M5TTF3_9CNID